MNTVTHVPHRSHLTVTASDEGNTQLRSRCPECRTTTTITVRTEGLVSWMRRALIQVALPELTDGQRELLLTGYCQTCWDTVLFPPRWPRVKSGAQHFNQRRNMKRILTALAAAVTVACADAPTVPEPVDVAGTWKHDGAVDVELRLDSRASGCAAFMVYEGTRTIVAVEGSVTNGAVEIAVPPGWASDWSFVGSLSGSELVGTQNSSWDNGSVRFVRDPLTETWAETYDQACRP